MSKYSKVYLRNKKQSNISLPLRFSFLRSIFVDSMSVKNAALKWKIHYSSAKIIVRQAKKTNMQPLFNQQPTNAIHCTWRSLDQERKSVLQVVTDKEGLMCDSADSSMCQDVEYDSPNKIEVVSTIGWNFLSVLQQRKDQ